MPGRPTGVLLICKIKKITEDNAPVPTKSYFFHIKHTFNIPGDLFFLICYVYTDKGLDPTRYLSMFLILNM